ncbi:MAG: DUF1292 domain-containing protein [Lachnospiraceae bacterium]|nr:DUF1292 domain-containing protein [Lachnospiraceae bacterium]
MGQYETIPFLTEDGEKVDFYILEQTMISGVNYLLVTDDIEAEETEVLMMRENPDSDGVYASYEIVDDEDELKAVSTVFEELIDDVDIELLYD